MIDSITIFTKGGTVLYHNQPSTLHRVAHDNKENQRDVINSFISSVLLGKRENKRSSTEGRRREILSNTNQSSVVAEWLDGDHINTIDVGLENGDQRNWIVLVIYHEVAIRKLQGVDALLSLLFRRYAQYHEHYCKQYQFHETKQNEQNWNRDFSIIPPYDEFDSTFHSIIRKFQDQLTAENTSSISSLEKNHKSKSNNNRPLPNNSNKKGKEKTVWHDGKQKITKAAFAELDMSKEKVDTRTGELGIDGIREDERAIAEAKAAYMPAEGEKPAWEEEYGSLEDLDIAWNTKKQDMGDIVDDSTTSSSSIRGFFSKLLSPNSPLTKADLEPTLNQMQQLLTSKNVAPSTAQAICEVVEKQLLGKKVGTLVGVRRAVRHALEDAVEMILRPEMGGLGGRLGMTKGKSVDVLRGVVEKKERGKSGGLLGFGSTANGSRPYVIVMIGINGVGKSTSLAKIAYYLKSNQCNPLLAACDTFRSGAVEQLSVHASCLSVPLYHQGYAKDPSAVAKAAIAKAAEDGHDVVLVDTAGRMQNNIPLMKALAKLVMETQPDLVLFVCEALVGNDGMDQLTMFQKALTSGGHTRSIDGIVLTKFDTVSDKVGAALTLTHLTGVPIAFCGTGQKYNHLKSLSVPFVIQNLFS